MHRRIGSFERHLHDAIALNRLRAPLYAALSGGASRGVSRLLITAEVLLLPVARWFDHEAEPYHRAGVPLLDALFVSMTDAPEFGSLAVEDDGPAVEPLRGAAIRRRVQFAFREGRFDGAAEAIANELRGPGAEHHGNAMVRHLLESAQRLATLAPAQVERSRERGLPSPEPLLRRLFLLHLWGLNAASMLDRRARPLHLRGIPILAQDLPPIPCTPIPSADD